jgi:hypothetical protein
MPIPLFGIRQIDRMYEKNLITSLDDPILFTGSNGFTGSRVVDALLRSDFSNIRALCNHGTRLDGDLTTGRACGTG